jgi:hypothetical protein
VKHMPWYSFVAQWPDGRSKEVSRSRLSRPEMARRYAGVIAKGLRLQAEYHDPALKMIIKDRDGTVVCIVPA